MSVLIIGEIERKKIAEAVANATAYPVPEEVLMAGAVPDLAVVKLKDRKPGYERPPSANVLFRGGFRAAFSMEHQPSGLCSHLSVSVFNRPRRGLMPSPEAVIMIAEAFGVKYPPDRLWTEEFDPGEYAINLLSMEKPK